MRPVWMAWAVTARGVVWSDAGEVAPNVESAYWGGCGGSHLSSLRTERYPLPTWFRRVSIFCRYNSPPTSHSCGGCQSDWLRMGGS